VFRKDLNLAKLEEHSLLVVLPELLVLIIHKYS
jgi:hypothetical protein